MNKVFLGTQPRLFIYELIVYGSFHPTPAELSVCGRDYMVYSLKGLHLALHRRSRPSLGLDYLRHS